VFTVENNNCRLPLPPQIHKENQPADGTTAVQEDQYQKELALGQTLKRWRTESNWTVDQLRLCYLTVRQMSTKCGHACRHCLPQGKHNHYHVSTLQGESGMGQWRLGTSAIQPQETGLRCES
jgi:hypothetical protein